MQKFPVSLVSLCVLSSLSLLGCSNEDAAIDLVKQSPVQYANMKMGKMLDTTTLCTKPTWTYQETERGEQFVKYQCVANVDINAIDDSVSADMAKQQAKMKTNVERLKQNISIDEQNIQELIKHSELVLNDIEGLKNNRQRVASAKMENAVPIIELGGLVLLKGFAFNVPAEKWENVFNNAIIDNRAANNARVGTTFTIKTPNMVTQFLSEQSLDFGMAGEANIGELSPYIAKLLSLPKGEKLTYWKNEAAKQFSSKGWSPKQFEEAKRGTVNWIQKSENELMRTYKAEQDRIKRLQKDNQERQKQIDELNEALQKPLNWGQLQTAEFYVRFDVNMEEEKVVDTRGPRSGYVLTWKDGTKLDQFGLSMFVPFYIENSAVDNDTKQMQRWQTNLSNPRTMQKLYELGQKPNK